jgi:predicted 3-demethylubiquinone-9 3-methyltransferase (glyoxalase superfamily)
MQLVTFLFFRDQAEEAARFYCSVFKDSKLGAIVPGPGGSVMAVNFRIGKSPFVALNGNTAHPFTEATSFLVGCKTQREIDSYWKKLLAKGGQEGRCGWLKDRFGVSWQVVPDGLGEWISTRGGLEAMLGMTKLNIAALKRAAR